MELRESSSPVPAQMMLGSLGAIAISPIETTRWLSNTGRNVVPLLVVFQMPPVAAAMKNVFEGLGMPSMSVIRPLMFAGPIARQRSASKRAESRGRTASAPAEGPAPSGAAAPEAPTLRAVHGISPPIGEDRVPEAVSPSTVPVNLVSNTRSPRPRRIVKEIWLPETDPSLIGVGPPIRPCASPVSVAPS